MAHSVHTTEAEYRRMAATGTSVVHCPDSNFQLMSGYFDAAFTDQMNVNVSLGTDVGASGNKHHNSLKLLIFAPIRSTKHVRSNLHGGASIEMSCDQRQPNLQLCFVSPGI